MGYLIIVLMLGYAMSEAQPHVNEAVEVITAAPDRSGSEAVHDALREAFE